jgi:hypothetical protein
MQNFAQSFNALWQTWAKQRQFAVNWLLSKLYERPVQVVPTHAVGLAGAAVLWLWQGGQRQLVMVRPKEGADTRARFVSCLGLGSNPEMATALRQTLKMQLGETFTKLLPARALALDEVAAAPLLTMTDEDTGGQLPLQVLAWVAELRPNQLETLELSKSFELVLVAENAIGSAQVSPTHRTLWQAVQRHVPKAKAANKREDSVALVEDDTRLSDDAASRKGGRVLH